MRVDRIRTRRVAMAAVVASVIMCGTTPSPRVEAAGVLDNSLHARFAVAARHACRERGVAAPCTVVDVARDTVARHIAHYRILLRVGPGPFDMLAIHRVVREIRPGVPARTEGTFFFLHGSSGHFTLSLLQDVNMLAYLAEGSVDVWGVDLRWVQVPREQSDFSVLKDWTFATQIADIRLATRLARHARRLTGQGFGRLNLAGASLGASLVYAVANEEAALPHHERDVDGLIPIDTIYALPPGAGATRTLMCRTETTYRTALATGSYVLNSLGAIDAGALAGANPNGMSPSTPTLTNREFALNTGAALSFAPALPYHIYSIIRDPAGLPIDGTYTRPEKMFDTMAAFTPYRARATMADYFGVPCGQTDLPYDDHLAEITAPILYVGFAGGMAKEGLYILQLLGSTDVTTNFIQMLPDSQATSDFGHLDWQNGDDAMALVWEPIRSWIAIRADRW